MKNLYTIDPLITLNLSILSETNEARLLIEQRTLEFYLFKENIKRLSKNELQSFKEILLKAYDPKNGKDYFLETFIHVIDQQYKRL